jgi:uncharacterized membrane protein YeaQ/YmgE (transglycosylase-associated protein family)
MDAQLVSILVFLVIGAVAGWIAGQLMKGGGFGLVGNVIIGVIGSFVGGFLFGRYISGGLIGSIVTATLGAIVLLVLVKLFKKI